MKGLVAESIVERRTQGWLVAALVAILALGLVVVVAYRRQQAVIRGGLEAVRDFRSARVDLANGFLHVSLAREDGVFDAESGMALVRQALARIEGMADRPDWGWMDNATTDEMRRMIETFRQDLEQWRQAAGTDLALRLKVRGSYVRLESLATRSDLLLKKRLDVLGREASESFHLVLAVALLLIACLSGSLAMIALAERRARLQVKRREELQRLLLDLARRSLAESELAPNLDDAVLRQLVVETGMEVGVFCRVDEDTGFEPAAATGLDPAGRSALAGVRVELRPGVAVAVGDMIPDPWRSLGLGTLALRVLWGEGRPWGLLAFGKRAPSGCDDIERDFLEMSGRVVSLGHQRMATLAELRASEARYRLLAENVGDVVWVLDAVELRLLYISPSVERQRGFTPAEVLAAPVFFGVAPEAESSIRESFPRRMAAFEQGDPGAVTQKRELRQQRKNGSWLWIEMVSTLVRDPGGALRLIGVSRDISERKRVECELRESEARFRSVVEASPIAIYTETEGRFTYANGAAGRLFGEPAPAKLVGGGVLERFHPGDRERMAARLQALHERGEMLPLVEEHVVHPDGTVADVTVTAVAFSTDGRPGALLFGRDITDERWAKETLRMQDTLLRETGAIAKLGGWSLDPATGEGFWTEEVAKIHDLDPAAPTSREIGLGFFVGESRSRMERALQLAAGQGLPYDEQVELVTAKGRRKWVRAICYPVMENGRVVRLHGAFQDITELYEATQALRESEARFRELAETINEVFWISDPAEDRLLYVSPAFERIWGRPCASGEGSRARWTESLHPEDRARMAAMVADKPGGGAYDEKYRIMRPDGETRWIHDRAFPVRDAEGKVVRVVGVAEDVTEKERMQGQFLRTQRLEAIGALAGGVAHDLNNILTPVLMSIAMLKDGAAERDRELLAMIEQSTRRGAEVIRQLLAFSRGVEGTRVVLEPRHLIREMASIIRETFPREITLAMELDAELWPIEANSTQLHQVLMNLCVNARDAMPQGGRLTLSGANRRVEGAAPAGAGELAPGPYVVIGVADTGTGMSAEVQTRIFEPFFTTKEQGKGTGLGLSTVLGIVRSHGGHVSVYSEVGRGTQFRLYLPARPAEQAGPAEEPGVAACGQGELILVVDDEQFVRESTRAVLERARYRVLLAEHGEAALLRVSERRAEIRLVLTDVMMPVMDGIALSRALRTVAPEIPVVATSGLDHHDKRTELEAAGVRATLSKPCENHELLATVAGILAPRR